MGRRLERDDVPRTSVPFGVQTRARVWLVPWPEKAPISPALLDAAGMRASPSVTQARTTGCLCSVLESMLPCRVLREPSPDGARAGQVLGLGAVHVQLTQTGHGRNQSVCRSG